MDIPSLFMIPSAVSSGKVHSVFPNSTDADFDFNRDSDATRVNSEGLIERVGYYGSEEITNGSFDTDSNWVKGTGWSIANGKASNDGSQSGTSEIYQTGVVVIGKTYKLVYNIVDYTSGTLRIRCGNTFDVTNNAIGTYTAFLTATSNAGVGIQASADFIGSIDNVSVKEVTGDRARLNYEIEGGLVNTKPSLLLEPQRTNTAEYSENAAVYTYNDSTIRENVQIITPYGYKSQAVKIDAEFNEPYPIRAASFNLGSYSTNDVVTLSGFVKYNGYRYVQFGGYFGSESSRFDLIDGVIIQNQSNVISSSMVKFPNDWYKLTVTYTFQNTIGNGYLYAGWTLSWNSSFAFTNARSGGIYAWGLQAELGSYPTSYIPTNGSAQTRAAETCNGAGTSSIFESTDGIFYVEMAAFSDTVEGKRVSLSEDNADADYISFDYRATSNTVRVVYNVGGSNIIANSYNISSSSANFNKLAFRFKAGNHQFYANGNLIATSTSSSIYSAGTLSQIQFSLPSGAQKIEGKIRDIRVYNTKEMTDSEVDILLTKITS